jgi:hypothetical protein
MGWLSGLVDGVRSWWGGRPPNPDVVGRFTTIDEALARMREVHATLDPGDGVAAFSRMYLQVTELVRANVTDGFFENTAFITKLDVVFAGLYLDAVETPTPTQAWAPVFELRRAPKRLPIQFALAGLNAHINNDLPLAVVAACRALRLTPDSPGVCADYNRVNELLAAVQQQVRESFLEGVALEVDREHVAPVANLVGAWSINRARDAAWTNARVLWELDGVEPLRSDYAATLSRSVGLAGRLLLSPVDELA